MQGAMHGREHFTAWLLMALTDFALSMGYTDSVCYHIIPMSNPDGVCISQSGLLDAMQTKIYETDLMAGYTTADSVTYARQWKANAMGIDLNRNFESGWEVSLERADPSSEKHRGSKAFSAVESRALRDYTKAFPFNATISVHSHGSVIYYQYGNKQPVNDLSYSLALAAQAATGYTPLTYDGTTGAGYKDWAMDALGIPSLTLEIGCYSTPLEQRDIYNTFARCEALFPALNKWLQENPNEVTS
jgi:g-D-glutamyl-meso-diaminopimelate peptidase